MIIFFTVIISSILTKLGLFFVYFKRFQHKILQHFARKPYIVYRLKTLKFFVSFVFVPAPIILKTFYVLFLYNTTRIQSVLCHFYSSRAVYFKNCPSA